MADNPKNWQVGEDIPLSVFIADPVDGTGVTGQAAYITFSISRESDGYYWSGSGWGSGFTALTMMEPDPTNQPGRYRYTLSASGNNQADVYVAQAKFENPALPEISGNNFESHRSAITDVRVYEAEPTQ